MRTLFLIILFSFSMTQQTLKLVSTKPVDCDFFTTDNIENTYLIQGNSIIKLWASGNQNKYSNKVLGEIDFVDTQNPMQLLLYYKGVSQVVLLDNTLSL